MFFTAPRKSLFWSEKQNNEEPESQTESSKADNLLPPLSIDTHPLISDITNSRNSRFALRSSSYLESLSFNQTDSTELKNFLDQAPSTRKSENALSLKSVPQSAGLPPVKNKSLWSIALGDSQNEDFGSPSKKRSSLRFKTMEPRRSYMLNSSTKNQKIMAVEEDEKENVTSMSRHDHSFIENDENDSESSVYYEDEEDEENLTPIRQLRRRQLRKFLYAGYFVGIAITMQNQIRLYGTLKPIEKMQQPKEEIEAPKIKKYLPLMPSDNFRVTWTIILAIFSFLTAIITPYIVSFIHQDNETFEIINIVFDVVFGIDIIINFVSAYYDPPHGLITDLKVIALKYLKGWFIIDFLAIIPFESILKMPETDEAIAVEDVNKLLRLSQIARLYKWFNLLRLFKMLKLFSTNRTYNRIIKKIHLNIEFIRMLKFILNITLLNHFVGCIWFFLAKLDNFGPETWVSKHGIVDENGLTQYLISFSWALQTITTVGFGDIAPETSSEQAVAILWMIMGVAMYSFTIESLSKIIANMDRREMALKKKISTFNHFASKVKLPNFLRQKVQRFFELNHKENIYYWIDPNDMFNYLPEGLKDTLFLYSYHPMIKNIPILEMNANFTAALLANLKLLKLEKREILYRQEDPSREVYFISRGSIKMVNEFGQGIYTLVQGTYFGELELLKDTKRLCFAQACEVTVIIVCERELFLETLKKFPDVEEKIKKVAAYREDKLQDTVGRLQKVVSPQKGNKKPMLKSSDYFAQILSSQPKKVVVNQTFRPNGFQILENRIQSESSPLLPAVRSPAVKEEVKNEPEQEKMDNVQNLVQENKTQDTKAKITSEEYGSKRFRKDAFVKKKTKGDFSSAVEKYKDSIKLSSFGLENQLKDRVPSLIKIDDKMVSEESPNLNTNVSNFSEKRESATEVENSTEIDEKLKHLMKVYDGLMEIKKLKEITEQIFLSMDIKKENIALGFSTIAERQIKVNANVEKLFNLVK